MKKILFLACLFCLGASAQNLSTSGAISAASTANTCTATSCVYYQLPSGATWVTLQIAGTWSGSVGVYSITSQNATYQNLNSQTWMQQATLTSNGTWAVATGNSTFILVQSSSFASGSANITMTASSTGSPLVNPILAGNLTVSGINQSTASTSGQCWNTQGGYSSCGYGPGTVVPITSGGTGATTSTAALANLGGFPLTGGTLTGPLSGTSATFSGPVAAGTTYQLIGPSANVQTAINAMSAAGGGTVELQPGTYASNPITSLPSNVTVKCASYLGCVMQYSTSLTLGSASAITYHAGLLDMVFDFQNNNAGLTLNGFQDSKFALWVRKTGTAHPLTITATANENNFYNNELPLIYISDASYGLTLDGHTNLTGCGGTQIGYGGAIFGNHFGLVKIGAFQSPADSANDGVGGNGVDFVAGVDTNNFDNIFVTLSSTNATGNGVILNSYCNTQYGDIAGNHIGHLAVDMLDASTTGSMLYVGNSQTLIDTAENGANVTVTNYVTKTAGTASGLNIGYAWSTPQYGSETLPAPAFETGGLVANGDVVLNNPNTGAWIVRPSTLSNPTINFGTTGAGYLGGIGLFTHGLNIDTNAGGYSALTNQTAATSGANQPIPTVYWQGNSWNGSASYQHTWSWSESLTTSGAPTFHTLILNGPSDGASNALQVPQLYLPNGNQILFANGSHTWQLNLDSSGNFQAQAGNSGTQFAMGPSGNLYAAFANPVAATSGANQPAPCFYLDGNDWNGSASVSSQWSLCDSTNASGAPTYHTLYLAFNGLTSNTAFAAPGKIVIPTSGGGSSILASKTATSNVEFDLPNTSTTPSTLATLSLPQTFTGVQQFADMRGSQAVTITVGAGAGTGATATCDTGDGYACTQMSGVVTLVAGTSAAPGDLFTITWGTALANLPACTYSNASTTILAGSSTYWDTANTSTTKASLATTATIGTPNTFKLIYRCGS